LTDLSSDCMTVLHVCPSVLLSHSIHIVLYLLAEEAKPIFIKSQLLTGHLAHVWNLADYDHDGNLSVNEFVLATHLMRFLKSGV
jgi:hypothetical protein